MTYQTEMLELFCNTNVSQDEYGTFWVFNNYGEFLCEAHFQTDDETVQEMENAGYVRLPYKFNDKNVFIHEMEIEESYSYDPTTSVGKFGGATLLYKERRKVKTFGRTTTYGTKTVIWAIHYPSGTIDFDNEADAKTAWGEWKDSLSARSRIS